MRRLPRAVQVDMAEGGLPLPPSVVSGGAIVGPRSSLSPPCNLLETHANEDAWHGHSQCGPSLPLSTGRYYLGQCPRSSVAAEHLKSKRNALPTCSAERQVADSSLETLPVLLRHLIRGQVGRSNCGVTQTLPSSYVLLDLCSPAGYNHGQTDPVEVTRTADPV